MQLYAWCVGVDASLSKETGGSTYSVLQKMYGRSFIIQSDHKPLEKLLHEKNKLPHMAAPRIKRCLLTYLSRFGKCNNLASEAIEPN